MCTVKRWALFLVALLTSWQVNAQTATDIVIGKRYQIQAQALGEERHIQVYLPESYYHEGSAQHRYPVIYLLDGESNFNYLSAFVDKLTRSPYPAMPESIIIGIENTNRTRDLTPTAKQADNMNAEQRNKIQGETGGNALFFDFLENDLYSYVNKTYRTNGYNTLIGHSFGGITALNHMLNGKDIFNAYIVHDPSIWWDDQVMLKRFKAAQGKDFKHKFLFLTQVGERENNESLSDHYRSIKEFNSYLGTQPFKNLNYQYAQYATENHGTIPLKGNLDGLRYVFDGFTINIKQIAKNPALIEQSFTAFNKKMHFEFKPSPEYLTTVLNFLEQGKQEAAVKEIRAYQKRLGY